MLIWTASLWLARAYECADMIMGDSGEVNFALRRRAVRKIMTAPVSAEVTPR